MGKSVERPFVLIVDDESAILETLKTVLKEEYNVWTAQTGQQALEIFSSQPINLIFLDIKLPDINGIELLRKIKKIDSTIPVIMATAYDSARLAIQSLQSGAYNYLTKPFDVDEVLILAKNAIESAQLLKEVMYFRWQREETKIENIIGRSSKMEQIYKMIRKVMDNNSTILISGESGTGKELIARAIHFNSCRVNKPFVPVNCAGIPESLMASELFGYEKGAFTGALNSKLGMFELAHEGTLFLDEISSLKLDLQSHLLRVLEEKEIQRVGGTRRIRVDIRIISATNINLKQAVQEGKFRQDLYYRLNVVPIEIPPLRERREDIPLLIEHFLKVYNKSFRKNIKEISREAQDCLINYDWPGNVRELRNIIERLVAIKDNAVIGIEDLPMDICFKRKEKQRIPVQDSLKEVRSNFEREYIEAALEKNGGSRVKTAKTLGIHRNALLNKIKNLGINK